MQHCPMEAFRYLSCSLRYLDSSTAMRMIRIRNTMLLVGSVACEQGQGTTPEHAHSDQLSLTVTNSHYLSH